MLMPSSCRIYLSLFQYRGTVPVRPRTRVTLTSLTGTLFAYVSPYVPPSLSWLRSSRTHLAESILAKVDYVTGRFRMVVVLSVVRACEVVVSPASNRAGGQIRRAVEFVRLRPRFSILAWASRHVVTVFTYLLECDSTQSWFSNVHV